MTAEQDELKKKVKMLIAQRKGLTSLEMARALKVDVDRVVEALMSLYWGNYIVADDGEFPDGSDDWWYETPWELM